MGTVGGREKFLNWKIVEVIVRVIIQCQAGISFEGSAPLGLCGPVGSPPLLPPHHRHAGQQGPGVLAVGPIRETGREPATSARTLINSLLVVCEAWPWGVGGLLVSSFWGDSWDTRWHLLLSPRGRETVLPAAADPRLSQDRGGWRGESLFSCLCCLYIQRIS